MRRLGIATFLVFVVGFAAVSLAGCAAWQTARGLEQQQDRVGQEQQQPKPPAQEITDARQEAREGIPQPAVPQSTRPPESTLSFGERTVIGVLGTFCWQSDTVGLCVDAAGPAIPDEGKTLSVPAGSVMVFDYGGRSLNSAGAAAYPLRRGEQVGEDAKTLRTLRRGDRTEIPAELPPGEYVVDVFVTMPEGDASYYFRIAVGGAAGELPDSGGPDY